MNGNQFYVKERNWGVSCGDGERWVTWVSGISFITFGGTCSAPSLIEPGDGATPSNRTITFRWSAPSNCSPDGYTFRVKNVSDMDSGGTTIVDTGVGGTERTETINGWDNTDLYWSGV